MKSPAASVGGAIATLGAAAAGRFLGWAFGLQLLLPIVAGVVATAQARKRFPQQMQSLVGGVGLSAAVLAYSVLQLIFDSVQYGFHLGPMGVVVYGVALGALFWVFTQPGLPSAGLLAARHAYATIMALANVPNIVRSFSAVNTSEVIAGAVDSGIWLALNSVALFLLARGLVKLKAPAAVQVAS